MDPRQQLAAMQAIITQLQADIQLLQQRQSRPKTVLPDPEKFNGSAHRFDTWLPSIRAKLRVDGAAIGDSIAQFYYVYLNLESNVQATVLPQLAHAERNSTWDCDSILQQLIRVYDNPNKVQEAEDKLLGLKQGTDSIPTYIAKFERVLYEASGQDWPDINKISVFRNGLSSTVRNRLNQQLNLPQSYPDFIRIVQQLAGRGHSGFTDAPGAGHTFQPRAIAQRPHQPDAMDINTIQFNQLDLADARATFERRDRALATRRARPVSPKSRQQYRKEGRCVRCGESSHWVANCPLKPATRKEKNIFARMAQKAWEEAYNTSDDEREALEGRFSTTEEESDSDGFNDELGQLQRGEL